MMTYDELFKSPTLFLQKRSGADLIEFLEECRGIIKGEFKHLNEHAEYSFLTSINSRKYKQCGTWYHELRASLPLAIRYPNFFFQICKEDEKSSDIIINNKKIQIVQTIEGEQNFIKAKALALTKQPIPITGKTKHDKVKKIENLKNPTKWQHSNQGMYASQDIKRSTDLFQKALEIKKDITYPSDVGLLIYCNNRELETFDLFKEETSISVLENEIKNILATEIAFPFYIVTSPHDKVIFESENWYK